MLESCPQPPFARLFLHFRTQSRPPSSMISSWVPVMRPGKPASLVKWRTAWMLFYGVRCPCTALTVFLSKCVSANVHECSFHGRCACGVAGGFRLLSSTFGAGGGTFSTVFGSGDSLAFSAPHHGKAIVSPHETLPDEGFSVSGGLSDRERCRLDHWRCA